jgi:predicted amidophosphoribosyltransferase
MLREVVTASALSLHDRVLFGDALRRKVVRVLMKEILALLAPPLCLGCRMPLGAAGVGLCATCLRGLPWLGDRVCRRCALPRHGGRACPASGARFATAWAPVAYEGTALVLVRALKFRGALQVAELMAAQMAANAPPWAIAGATAVVPAPPVASRARRRGFDPAALIAAGLARRLGLPVVGCLARSGRAARQLGARRAERQAPGRITIRARAAPPASVLLVDDVHTTGATLSACARGLTAAGSTTVRSLSYARTL